jgi:hypothetical protein
MELHNHKTIQNSWSTLNKKPPKDTISAAKLESKIGSKIIQQQQT